MTQIGRYTLLDRLGSSVLGAVYKAQDTASGSLVTLKVLQLGLLDDASSHEMDARLQRELEAAARLQHPGIERLLEVRSEGRTALIASELIEGPTITAFVRGLAGPRVTQVVTAVVQMLEALDFAHRQSVIHRDLKPTNVLVQGGRIKITDFGMAGIGARSRGDTDTLADTEYMAPEQFRGGTIDKRCDIHAVGTILYELLTGKSPFAGDAQSLTAMFRVLDFVPPPPSQVRSGSSPAFDRIVGRALAKSPAERFVSAQQFREELSAAYVALARRPLPDTLLPVASAPSRPATPAVPTPVAAFHPTAPLPDARNQPERRPAPAETSRRNQPEELRPALRSEPAHRAGAAAVQPEPAPVKDQPLPAGTVLVPKPAATPSPGARASAPARAQEPPKESPVSAGTVLLTPKAPAPRPASGAQAPARPATAVDATRAETAREPAAPAPAATAESEDVSGTGTVWLPALPEFSELIPPAELPAAPMNPASAAQSPPSPAAPAQQVGRAGSLPPKRPIPLTEAAIAHGGRVLAQFVGPIAIVFSRRAAQDAHDERRYIELLAAHLTDPGERAQFLRKVRQRPA